MAGYIKSDNPKSPYSKGCITIPVQEFDGHMVIDRQYYDDKNNYLKFNGSRS